MSALSAELEDLKKKLLVELEDEKLTKVSYGGFDIRLSSQEIPTIKDFNELWKYAKRTNKHELFIKKLNTTGFKELFQNEDGTWKKTYPKWADLFIRKTVNIKRSKK